MKRGFTLIELLAVIVILAIIALIAVPIVVNIINDSKTSSDEQSVELYIDAVKKTIVRKQLKDSTFNPKECEILDNGFLNCDKEEIKVEIKGEVPESGIVMLNEEKINYKSVLLNGKYYNNVSKLILDSDNNGKISIGDKYAYSVNGKDIFNFYVLSFNENNTVNLIMDRNICNDGKSATSSNPCPYTWYTSSTNKKGPLTAMHEIYSATKNWTNVSNLNFDYDDIMDQSNAGYVGSTNSGYSGMKIINGFGTIKSKSGVEIKITENAPLKARLPRYSEVYGIDGKHCTDEIGSCPYWLIDNLHDSSYFAQYPNKNNMNNIFNYWLIDSFAGAPDGARSIHYGGRVGIGNALSTNNAGIRPVITVSIDDLSSKSS